MKIRRRTEITIQTDRVLAAIDIKPPIYAECATCAGNVVMLTAEEAANTSRVSLRTIFRLIENGQLHFQEMPEGLLLICAASLQNIEIDSRN